VFLVEADLALPLALTFALLYLAFLGFSTARLVNLSRTMPRA
jgi:VIT1/CCC1 family predicted Fe2+/Mn2+ transporter